jgi:hypothetical protein
LLQRTHNPHSAYWRQAEGQEEGRRKKHRSRVGRERAGVVHTCPNLDTCHPF